MANTSWSPTDKQAGITLTNANLTATSSGGGVGIRAVDRQLAGKFYFELTMNTSNTSTAFGVTSAGAVLSASTGVIPGAIVNMNGTIFTDGASTGKQLGTRASGDILGLAVDLSNRLAWFRVAPSGNWNASATSSPATGTEGVAFTGGIGIPMYPYAYFNAAGNIVANFGDTAFSGTVPSGFTAGFLTGTPPLNEVTTQVAAEHWGVGDPALSMQLTQIAVEQWAAVTTVNSQFVLTQAVIEQWASVAVVTAPPVSSQVRAWIMA